MRRITIVILSLTVLLGLIVMMGCEGEQGVVGAKGDRGRTGIPGTDPELGQPADRYFGLGLTNSHASAVNGDFQVYLTFDSTARASRDTVVSSRLMNPPLIDGLDGEEPEWGAQKSRIRLAFLNNREGLTDPEIYEVVTRSAWDDYYIYQLFQWKERKVSQVSGGRDSSIYEVGQSRTPHELFYDNRRKIIEKITPTSDTTADTTFFQWTRRTLLSADTLFCTTNPETGDTIECFIINAVYSDTVRIWMASPADEDKLAIFWTDAPMENWSQLAFREFFNFPGSGTALPSGLNVDAWVWGSARSNPVSIMDDWSLTSSGKSPDEGAAPYVENYLLPDSVPRYQSYRDPNFKTARSPLGTEIYPLWYFDAVGYSYSGWDPNQQVYLPSVITTIPSGSRADIYSRATFDDSFGTWTLEIRRARKTYNGDDVVF